MGIRVLEIHHHAVRIDSEPPKLEAVQKFYNDVLGLEAGQIAKPLAVW